jgi:hypothetical protein
MNPLDKFTPDGNKFLILSPEGSLYTILPDPFIPDMWTILYPEDIMGKGLISKNSYPTPEIAAALLLEVFQNPTGECPYNKEDYDA